MADLIRKGQEWEAAKRKQWRSTEVTIVRGLEATPNVPATIGTTTHTVDSGTGLTYEEKTRDFIIDRALYVIAGEVTEPQEDDLIVDASSGTEILYRVLPQLGEPEKRWSDPYGIAWRISTRYAAN